MSPLLRLPSFYLSLPLLVACGLTLLTYDLPPDYMEGLLLLAAAAVAILAVDVFVGIRLPRPAAFLARDYTGTRDAFVALVFAALIVVFCLLDLALFPVPLFTTPNAYANMEGGRDHIRHVSDMCWVLPPIGLLCARQRWLRAALVVAGFVFPVLVIDRNRIFAALFSVALIMLLRRSETKALPWKRVLLLIVAGTTVFSVLGILRSGTLDYVTLPFSDLYRAAPQGVKWLLLYASAGPYNFSSILAKHYADAHFLINQLVPMAGSIATADTGIPLDASNINVGTEFFPFLMALGPVGAIGSMAALYLMLLWSVRRVQPTVPLFGLLIFLRVSYTAVMAPFAPQAFTWTSFGFIALCLLLQLVAALLPDGRARDQTPGVAAGHGATSSIH
ncbi:hypothetical protein SAMN04487785_108101 [Dyella jiangningensis]|uniref:hypothetical protein n=1 Tax=Dyella sp. AtDHG13 TaxID=1938897 RepID=UPI000887070A|nr:hypothetical protein [Dyella sp. AtDHG13]PXV55900.1 hypothetical protein BDW41_11097 [Dyella sp. AtDHG13]SDK51650.1 hypothetical protein SAMN04487785_108101 [Dyella jiangningensis]